MLRVSFINMSGRGWEKLHKSNGLVDFSLLALRLDVLLRKMTLISHTDSLMGRRNLSAHFMHDIHTLPDFVTYIITGLHIATAGISIPGNIIILTVFLLKKISTTKANCYLVAIATSDIALAICFTFSNQFNHLSNKRLILGLAACSIASYIQIACVIQRSLTLVASSLDRYYAIRWPLKKQLSRAVVVYTIGGTWIISLILTSPLVLFSFGKYDNVSSSCNEVWPNESYRQTFSIVFFVLTFCFPLIVMFFTYYDIVRILSAKPPGEEYIQLIRRRSVLKRKAIKQCVPTVCAYAVCWLPIHVITFIGDVTPTVCDANTLQVLGLFAQWLAVSNSAINPLIFVVSKQKLRAQVKRLFCLPSYKNTGNSTVQEETSRNIYCFPSSRTCHRWTHELPSSKRRSTQETIV